MDLDDDRKYLKEEFERLTTGRGRAQADIEQIFDQAARWRFGTLISQAIADSNRPPRR